MIAATPIPGGTLAHDLQARALWKKLRGLSLDGGTGPNTFAARLAREQGWSAGFTDRVIEEYRRFLLLFALEQRQQETAFCASERASKMRIVPSVKVDQAWHLHLLYTESYWVGLCQNILGQPLHHQPADGSAGETATLDHVYRDNMEAYLETFGEPAPNDIWPAPPGTPRSGTPLDVVLRANGVPAGSPRRSNSLMLVVLAVPVIAFAVIIAGKFLDLDDVPAALGVTAGIVIAVGGGIALFASALHGATSPGRRRPGNGQDGGCSGSGDLGGSSGDGGHSHGSHGGHGDSGGGHSCGGHGCGGHGCGGH